MRDTEVVVEEGTIFIVRAKKAGYEYLPVFPARRGDDASSLPDGVMLNCLGYKEMPGDVLMYEMEIVTGKKSGDTVYVGSKLLPLLEVVPSKKRIR